MHWNKLIKNHYFDTPVAHIYTANLFDVKRYDILYENQNNLTHQEWKNFKDEFQINFEFREKLQDVDFGKDIICLWFFKERADSTISYISVNGKQLKYAPNTFFITKSKDIKFVKTKRTYIRNPMFQIEMTNEKFNEICERLK